MAGGASWTGHGRRRSGEVIASDKVRFAADDRPAFDSVSSPIASPSPRAPSLPDDGAVLYSVSSPNRGTRLLGAPAKLLGLWLASGRDGARDSVCRAVA